MAEVTYHFNSRSTGNWSDPDKMIDGILTDYAYSSSTGTTEVLDGNTCPGDDLGTITKIELRAYGHGDGDDKIALIPFIPDQHHVTMPGLPGWSIYVDITNDGFAPDWLVWSDIVDLHCDVAFIKTGKANQMNCAKVEIRVTYTPVGPPGKPTQYMAGNDCPEFPHEKDLQSDKLPCPPPY